MRIRIAASIFRSGYDGILLFLIVILPFTATITAASATKYTNVYGNELQRCSTSGTALTGYTRTGYCVEQSDDTGSHHICINLNSTTGGNFCDVTGQSNWCSSTDMPCDENDNDDNNEDPQDEATCAIENWCVCQWAFASYIQKAGGCDQIQDIQCNAINMEALRAYQSTNGYQQALQCLVERCNLSSSTNFLTKELRHDPAAVTGWRWLGVAGFIMAMVGTIYTTFRRSSHHYSNCQQNGPSASIMEPVSNKEDALLAMDGEAVVIR